MSVGGQMNDASAPGAAAVRSMNWLRSYGAKSSLSQYVSNTAAIFDTTSGLRSPDTRTFHSDPVTGALCVRFDDPMYAVDAPRCRWKSHAFACNRVVVVSYETRTSTPAAASSSS